jgi:toxin secretion/phage lysis holin
MVNANAVKNWILAALAASGGFLSNMLGGWDMLLQVLIVIMAVDVITGWMVAGVFHKSPKTETGALDSKIGFKGLFKKFSVLLLILVAAQLDKAIGGSFSRTAVILFFCGNEGLSILENLALMGIEYPAFLKNALEALKKDDNNVE